MSSSDDESITSEGLTSSEEYDVNDLGDAVAGIYQRPEDSGAVSKRDNKEITSRTESDVAIGRTRVNLEDLLVGPKGRRNKESLVVEKGLDSLDEARMNRIASYNVSKKNMQKWIPIVQENRTKKTLDFAGKSQPMGLERFSVGTKKQKKKSQREGFSEINSILNKAKVQDKINLEVNLAQLGKGEDDKERLREKYEQAKKLREIRSMMFFHDREAARKKRIKSRRTKRALRKEREKTKLSAEELAMIDPDLARKNAEERERKRALERATLKHKNTSKWVKRQLQRNAKDPVTRQILRDQVELGKKLMEKVVGNSSSEEEEEEEVEKVERGKVPDKAPRKQQPIQELPKKGLFGLKFIQEAIEKESKGEKEDKEKSKPAMPKNIGSGARLNFNLVKARETKLEAEEREEIAKLSNVAKEKRDRTSNMKVPSGVGEPTEKSKDVADAKEESGESKEEKPKADGYTGIDTESVLQVKKKAVDLDVGEELDLESDEDFFEKEKREEIEKIADELIEKEMGVSKNLPGWGTWAGEGVTENLQKEKRLARRMKKKRQELIKKLSEIRKDKDLSNVVIQENPLGTKRKKKYMLKDLPPMFENSAQYNIHMCTPIGKEWVTEKAHASLIEPSIVKKLGRAIDPIKYAQVKKIKEIKKAKREKNTRRSLGKRL